jgi:hypothetical protein
MGGRLFRAAPIYLAIALAAMVVYGLWKWWGG